MPTRHLSYFTRSSVCKLCELAGMELMWFRAAGIDIGDIMAWCESRGMQRDLKLWQDLSDRLQPALDGLEVGNHLVFHGQSRGGLAAHRAADRNRERGHG